MKEKKIYNNNVEYINKKSRKIKQRPKDTTLLAKPDKKDIRNTIWIILLFAIMFIVLISLPYISNYR